MSGNADCTVVADNTCRWICPRCNTAVQQPFIRGSRKECPIGHELEEVGGFWGVTIALAMAWPLWRALFLLAGLIWAPLEQFWGYGLLAMLFMIVWMPVKGIAYLMRGGPVRRLAPACFGMAAGSIVGGALIGVSLMLLFGHRLVR